MRFKKGSKVLGGGQFSVRTHWLAHETRVDKPHIRVPHSWQDGQWVPIEKISGIYGDVKFNKPIETNYRSEIRQQEVECLQESRGVSSKTLKRALPFCSSLYGKPKKVPKLAKVDAFAYQQETPGNKHTQASFNNITSLNDQCSVGSCSVSSRYVAVTSDVLSGDAEEENCSSPPEKEVAASIHRLELHAYRSTLEALYASGPLSWEKEALLTNLRINLHISNDEHLTELRHLISPATGVLD